MAFTDQLWQRIESHYDAILNLPFIQELTTGTLPEDVFLFYLQQDTLYLADFGRALALAGVRSDHADEMESWLKFAGETITVERALHKSFYDKYNIEPAAEKSPACFAYTNYLIATAAIKDNAVNIGALMPCFWIYREVGLEIHRQATDDNPYREWIDTYAGEAFNESVDQAIAMTNAVASREGDARLEEMAQAFVTSTELEWMFWESASRKETWPLASLKTAKP